MTVDQSNGHVYVVDANSSASPAANFRISEYDATGTFVKGFGVGVADGNPEPQVCTTVCLTGSATGVGAVGTGARGIAVDPVTHIVYFVAGAAKVAYYDGTTGAFLGELTGTEGTASPEAPAKFAGTTGIAIDSSNPLQHYLYVATGTGANSVIDKFKVPEPGVPTLPAYSCQITGKEIASATECNGTASKDGAFNGISLTSQKGADLAVDAAGTVYIAEEAARNTVSVFSSAGTFVKALTTTAPVAVAAASPGSIVVVGNGTLPAGAFEGGLEIQEIDVSTGAVDSELTLPTSTSLGIAVDSTGASSDGSVYAAEKGGKQLRKFVIALPPEVTGLEPDEGPTAGGNSVVITGDEFTGATEVKFGSTSATFAVDSDTQITATAPAGAAGTVDVTVTTPIGTSPNTVADDYTYVATPAITGVNPAKGPTAGANTVTITGTGLASGTEVKFGSAGAAVLTNSDTQITVTAPAGPAGTVDISVKTAGGTSPNTAADDYTYVATPAITGVNPAKGPTAGANTVTITGTNLAEATFKFGTSSATGVVITGGGTGATMVAPARAAGTVNVIATTAGGSSPNTAADDYTYVVAPVVTTTAGATEVTQTSAKVGGTVNPNSDTVSGCRIEYGTTTSYGATAPCSPANPSGSSATNVGASLSGLSVGTTYHFRVVATSAGGTGSGADQSFTTQASVVPTVPALPPAPPASCATDPLLCPPPDNVAKPGSAKPRGSNIDLEVTVPGPGALAASGKNLSPAKGTARGAGTVTLKLKLTSAGKKQLKQRGKVTVKVTIVFTPTGGAPGKSTKSVTFKASK